MRTFDLRTRSLARPHTRSTHDPACRLQLISGRSSSIARALNRKVEERGRIGLAGKGKVPKFKIIIHKSPLLHEVQELPPVGASRGADVGVCVGDFVEAIEPRTHIYAVAGIKSTGLL